MLVQIPVGLHVQILVDELAQILVDHILLAAERTSLERRIEDLAVFVLGLGKGHLAEVGMDMHVPVVPGLRLEQLERVQLVVAEDGMDILELAVPDLQLERRQLELVPMDLVGHLQRG